MMNHADELNVWYENRLVGLLWRDQGSPAGTGFRYDVEWLNGEGFAISQTLPLSKEHYPAEAGGVVQQFFGNLLPEGGARERVVRDLKIVDSDFDLLRAIGGDCAGALSILPKEYKPDSERAYTLISENQLESLVKRKGRNYQGISQNNRPRLSLAGAQDKCPVLFRAQQFFMPEQAAPSSHILKFEIPEYRNIPAYECFATMLARSVGLPTTDLELRSAAKKNYLLIRRYDRFEDEDGRVHRLHQEDFCQALGFAHGKKYEQDGGPSFADCVELVRTVSTDPAIDTLALLRWQIFNVLAGNSDGHAKNLSLLYPDKQQARLAPFYDLVCTRAVERIDARLAFSVGGERNPGLVTLEHWALEAKKCGIRPDYLHSQVVDLVEKLSQALPGARERFDATYGACPALQRVERIVRGQCKRLLGKRVLGKRALA
jgi:serine/threonine-protein kinase HipA